MCLSVFVCCLCSVLCFDATCSHTGCYSAAHFDVSRTKWPFERLGPFMQCCTRCKACSFLDTSRWASAYYNAHVASSQGTSHHVLAQSNPQLVSRAPHYVDADKHKVVSCRSEPFCCHSGCILLILLYTEPSTLTVSRYEVNAQQEQDSSNALGLFNSWTVQASYQTHGSPFSRGEPAKRLHSNQLMVSADGTHVVLITPAPGMLARLCQQVGSRQ